MRRYRAINCILLAVASIVLLGWVLHYGGYAATTAPHINEICTSNFSIATDPTGSYLDYIELYNPEDEDYVMEGLSLSNDKNDPDLCDLSAVTVPAHGYVILWMVESEEAADGAPAAAVPVDLSYVTAEDTEADEETLVLSCPQYYCPYALSRSGDYLYICNGDSRIVESLYIPALSYDTSYGRASDGASGWTGMTPTPGASNNDAEVINLDKADAPTLSVGSGFYDEAFELSIAHAPGTEVYYTLDGTTPTTESVRYEGAILIDDPSENPNVYSARTDIYLDNYTPEDPVDKAVVVRAIAVDKVTGATSSVVSATYFVGYGDKEAYDDVAVVSLITDPEGLFDYNSGIYVMGATYDAYIAKGGFGELPSSQIPAAFSDSSGHNYFRYMYTNSENHGRKWERKVTVEYYDASHTLQMRQTAGMRVAGESSRHNVHKSLNLFARSIYGEKSWPSLLWGYDDASVIRLRASSGETINWKETYVQSLAEDRAMGIQHSIPVAVFLDGEYWGLYQLTEQYDAAYFENHYDVSEEDLVVCKNHSIIQGDVTQGMQDYEDLEEIVTTYDMSQEHLYALAEERVDMSSLIDYYCTLTYLDNVDITAHHNQEIWKSTKEGGDNRWHYVLYDLDQTCGDASHNTIADYEDNGTLYWPMYLCANEEFKARYVTTMMDLANVEYSYQRVHASLYEKAGELESQAIASKQRYVDGDYNKADYAADVEALDIYFRERRSYIEQYLREDLGLGEIATVTVENSNPDEGSVLVNSSILTSVDYTYAYDTAAAEAASGEVADPTGSWTGEYFTDYAVTLSAAAIDGYEFVGWTGDIESTDATITVPLTEDGVQVRANFAKAE